MGYCEQKMLFCNLILGLDPEMASILEASLNASVGKRRRVKLKMKYV